MMSLSRFLSSPVRQVGPTLAALTGWVNSGITTSPASPAGAAWMWAASSGKATFWVVMAEHRVRALRSMVMVAVPVPGPPQVPGAVGQTSAAPESWMVKVAVFSSASAPLAAMTAPTADRTKVRTAMLTSRLPIRLTFSVGRTSVSGGCHLKRPSRRAGYGPAGHGQLAIERRLAIQWAAAEPLPGHSSLPPPGALTPEEELRQNAMIPRRSGGLPPTARR